MSQNYGFDGAGFLGAGGGGYAGLSSTGWGAGVNSSDFSAVNNTVLCQVSDWFGGNGGNSNGNPIQFDIQQNFQTQSSDVTVNLQGTVAPIDVGFSINILGFQIPILNLHVEGQ